MFTIQIKQISASTTGMTPSKTYDQQNLTFLNGFRDNLDSHITANYALSSVAMVCFLVFMVFAFLNITSTTFTNFTNFREKAKATYEKISGKLDHFALNLARSGPEKKTNKEKEAIEQQQPNPQAPQEDPYKLMRRVAIGLTITMAVIFILNFILSIVLAHRASYLGKKIPVLERMIKSKNISVAGENNTNQAFIQKTLNADKSNISGTTFSGEIGNLIFFQSNDSIINGKITTANTLNFTKGMKISNSYFGPSLNQKNIDWINNNFETITNNTFDYGVFAKLNNEARKNNPYVTGTITDGSLLKDVTINGSVTFAHGLILSEPVIFDLTESPTIGNSLYINAASTLTTNNTGNVLSNNLTVLDPSTTSLFGTLGESLANFISTNKQYLAIKFICGVRNNKTTTIGYGLNGNITLDGGTGNSGGKITISSNTRLGITGPEVVLFQGNLNNIIIEKNAILGAYVGTGANISGSLKLPSSIYLHGSNQLGLTADQLKGVQVTWFGAIDKNNVPLIKYGDILLTANVASEINQSASSIDFFIDIASINPSLTGVTQDTVLKINTETFGTNLEVNSSVQEAKDSIDFQAGVAQEINNSVNLLLKELNILSTAVPTVGKTNIQNTDEASAKQLYATFLSTQSQITQLISKMNSKYNNLQNVIAGSMDQSAQTIVTNNLYELTNDHNNLLTQVLSLLNTLSNYNAIVKSAAIQNGVVVFAQNYLSSLAAIYFDINFCNTSQQAKVTQAQQEADNFYKSITAFQSSSTQISGTDFSVQQLLAVAKNYHTTVKTCLGQIQTNMEFMAQSMAATALSLKVINGLSTESKQYVDEQGGANNNLIKNFTDIANIVKDVYLYINTNTNNVQTIYSALDTLKEISAKLSTISTQTTTPAKTDTSTS